MPNILTNNSDWHSELLKVNLESPGEGMLNPLHFLLLLLVEQLVPKARGVGIRDLEEDHYLLLPRSDQNWWSMVEAERTFLFTHRGSVKMFWLLVLVFGHL